MVQDIAYVTCSNQLAMVATSIYSIIKNNASLEYSFHVVVKDLDNRNKKIKKLKRFVNNHSRELFIYNLRDYIDKNDVVRHIYYLPIHFWRMCLPEIILADKILYLDNDTLVNKSIKTLLSKSFNNHLLMARVDYAKTFDIFLSHLNEDIYSKSSPYFNSGVLLWNLTESRNQNIAQILLDTTLNNWGECFPFPYHQHDQLPFNIVFHSKWAKLSTTYNAFAGDDDSYNCHIIHYVGLRKPWSNLCPIELSNSYFRQLIKSPFPLWNFQKFINRIIQN